MAGKRRNAEEKGLQALQQIDARLAPAPGAAASFAGVDACTVYRGIRPLIGPVLVLVGKQPLWGGALKRLIEFVLKIADMQCSEGR